MPMPPPLRGARAAFVFLTRIPIDAGLRGLGGRGQDYSDADWRWAAGWFPFVGLLLGAIGAGAWLALPLAPLTKAVLVVALGVMLTGAFHEDGLADTADAMGGAYDRDRLLEILKDSRLGTFGVAALSLTLLLRVALLAELDAAAPLALICAGCLARVPPVWLMVAMPYVTDDARSKSRQLTRATLAQALLASVFGLGLLAALIATAQLPWSTGAWMLAALLVTAVISAQRFHARAGGLTGDFLGANEQLGECAVLCVLAAS